MNKNDTIFFLSEALTYEDVPTIGNLEEIKELIKNITKISEDDKKRINLILTKMINESLWHSQEFTEMIKVVKDAKD